MSDHRILIYGNSGSGKTTMAQRLAKEHGLPWLSLDDIAWAADHETPVRRPMSECGNTITEFMQENPTWIMDGCYGELIQFALSTCTELRFLHPGVDACLANCRQRPWEPDKYPTKDAQDAMLETLMEWVRAYPDRDDDCSLAQHRQLFDSYSGKKRAYRSLTEYDEAV